MINQRPLTYIGTDPQDVTPITPAHLYSGRPLGSLPDVPRTMEATMTKRYQYLQHLQKQL